MTFVCGDKIVMAHKPGSFSKNFAWGPKEIGLRKLHQAIRNGFGGRHRPVERNWWREASRIEGKGNDLSLIPLNFFLHNTIIDGKNYVSVDELVLRALDNDHSAAFDRLALFALHLSRGGARKGANTGEARSAPWANHFVREHLWKGGSWQTHALDEANLDAFFSDQLDAQQVTRTKVRANYRRLFELCGYLPASAETIKADPASWAVSAVYLKWDRLTLDGELSPTADIETLTNQALHADLHKLLGTTKSKARQIVEVAAPLYIDAGRLDRIAHTPQQLRNLTAKIEAGAIPRYGDAAEKAQRQAILRRIAAIERELEGSRPAHGGMGHNNPPEDDPAPATEEAVKTVKAELEKEQPVANVVVEQTSFLQKAARWLGKRLEKGADKFMEALGTTAGVAAAGSASLALWQLQAQLGSLITMLTRWLSMISGTS